MPPPRHHVSASLLPPLLLPLPLLLSIVISATVASAASGDSSEPGAVANDMEWHRLEDQYHGWLIGGLLVLVATFLSLHLIYQHLRHYTKPAHQRHIVRILLMVPIYSVTAWLTYRYYHLAVGLEFVRSIYEAVVIYEFFQLLLVYLGDSESEQRHHLQSKPPRAMLAPFCCWRVDPGSRYFLMDCKIGVLQYVVVRPLTTIYAVAMERSGRFHPESSSPADGYFWFVLVNFVSTSVAMYMLIFFYLVIHRDIADYRPVTKFLSVKFVIFMTFWQSLAISICDSLGWIPDSSYWTAENIALSVQSLLIIVEMVVASVWHTHHNCFGYQPFTNAGAFGSTSLATLSASASTFASSTAAFSTQRLGASAKDTTNPWRSLLDIFNPAETIREIVNGGRYFIARWVLWWRKTHAGHEPIVDQRTPDLDERDDGPGEGGAGGEAVLDMQLPAERRRGDVYEEQTRALTGV